MTPRLLLMIWILLASACSPVQVGDHEGKRPGLDPRVFLNGQLTAHGIIQDRSGKVMRHFNADISASWKEGSGILVEDFVFDNGELQHRVWILSPDSNGGYIGTADDVVGKGKLSFSGNAMFLDYTLRIPYGDGTIDVRVDDRMYLVSPNVLINESRMSKFGFNVGKIILTIVRQPTGSNPL
jgi:hypothetical protein